MKYNIIENGDYVLGKAEDIIGYLVQKKIEINGDYLNAKLCLEELLKEEENIVKVMQEIIDFDYQKWVILKLFRNEFNELDYEEINI